MHDSSDFPLEMKVFFCLPSNKRKKMILIINNKNNKFIDHKTGAYVYLNDIQQSKIVISDNYRANMQFQFRSPKNIIPVQNEGLYLNGRKINTDSFFGDYMNNTALAQQFLEVINAQPESLGQAIIDEPKLVYSNLLYISLPDGVSFKCADAQIAAVLGIETNKEYTEVIAGHRMINMNLCKSLKIYSSLAFQTTYIENADRKLLLNTPILWENGSITTITANDIVIQGNELRKRMSFEFLTDENLPYPLPEGFDLVMELVHIEPEPEPTQSEEAHLLNVLIQTMSEHNDLLLNFQKTIMKNNEEQKTFFAETAAHFLSMENEDFQPEIGDLQSEISDPQPNVKKESKVDDNYILNRVIDTTQQKLRRYSVALVNKAQKLDSNNEIIDTIKSHCKEFNKKLRSLLQSNVNENERESILNYPQTFKSQFTDLINSKGEDQQQKLEVLKNFPPTKLFSESSDLHTSSLLTDIDNVSDALSRSDLSATRNVNENEPN